jgi:hypothetical protein
MSQSHSHTSHYASVQKRVMAKFIDLAIVIFLGRLPLGSGGAVLGFLYSILADSMAFKKVQGQSIGKRIMHIRIASGSTHHTRMQRMKTSIIRNAPVGIVTFFMIIPIPGWILSGLIGVPLFLIELSLMIRAERHQRLGDVMAESVVLDCE